MRLDAPVTEAFGGGYRNWGFGDYNGSNANAPIDQTVLRFPVDENDQVFRQFIGMLPFQTEDRWRARDTNAFVSGGIMGSTRLGARILEFSDGTGFGGARGVIKTLSGRNTAGNISILVFGVGESNGTSATDIDFLDFNGDGYPDVVGAGSVQATLPNGALEGRRINLGYRFGEPEDWGGSGTLRFERSEASGTDGSAGFNTPAYSFGGGIASTRNRAGTESDLMDVNGDGLPDLVFKALSDSISSPGTAIQVRFNTGAGFLAPQDYTGALPRPIQSRSGVHRNLGLYFTISFGIPGTGIGVVINPGFHDGDSFGGSETQLRDFDGDGYADHIASDGAAVNVSLNRHGRTNLLKGIQRPLGATIALDYERAGNTPEHPQRRWVLASRTVFDGLAGDGADYQIATFAYQDGRWDRAERTFYGFRTVREEHRDTTGVTTANIDTTDPTALPLFRAIAQTFRTDSFYTKMLLERQITEDEGLETIDASGASLVMRAFGHSYLMDSANVLKDIQSIIRQKLSAKQRGLGQVGKLPEVYWRFR